MNTDAPRTAESPSPAAIADRLRGACVGVRQDLEVTRHLFRGEPAYLVRDPMTLQSHRLSPADYTVFVAIDRDRTLGETFETLVSNGAARREDEQTFYQFVLMLHRLNFLNLPISDDRLLYERHCTRQKARRREKLLGFLFLRIPLVNPDAFLRRTMRYAEPLFRGWFLALWFALVATAVFVAARNGDSLREPLQGILTLQNLPLIWLALIVLKVLHEFGHAYACKHYGGYVPEMGVYLILFTPCAYVDATASWGFTRRWQRLVVCLGGMYVESIVASIAVLVWASSGPGVLRDVAYNVLFLAGVMTVLFNINPLMRYDGYYILSDLLEVPNLRQRSTQCVLMHLRRIVLGLRSDAPAMGLRLRALLLSFGVAATAYRVTVMLAIVAIIAARLSVAGAVLGGLYLAYVASGLMKRLVRYLWYSPDTAPVRLRAVFVSIVLLVGLPATAVLVPIHTAVQVAGVLGREQETVCRARVDGFLQTTEVRPGQQVQAGSVLMDMANDACTDALARAGTQVKAAKIREAAYEAVDVGKAQEERAKIEAYEMELERRRRDVQDLVIRAEADGRVMQCLRENDVGRFVRRGDPLATIASGRWHIRTLLTEEEVAAAQPAVGDRVRVRPTAMPGKVLTGSIVRITPAGSPRIEQISLTHLGGGSIAVDPKTRAALRPYFEVAIALDAPAEAPLQFGMTCQVRFRGEGAPLARVLARRVIRFTDRLMQG